MCGCDPPLPCSSRTPFPTPYALPRLPPFFLLTMAADNAKVDITPLNGGAEASKPKTTAEWAGSKGVPPVSGFREVEYARSGRSTCKKGCKAGAATFQDCSTNKRTKSCPFLQQSNWMRPALRRLKTRASMTVRQTARCRTDCSRLCFVTVNYIQVWRKVGSILTVLSRKQGSRASRSLRDGSVFVTLTSCSSVVAPPNTHNTHNTYNAYNAHHTPQ